MSLVFRVEDHSESLPVRRRRRRRRCPRTSFTQQRYMGDGQVDRPWAEVGEKFPPVNCILRVCKLLLSPCLHHPYHPFTPQQRVFIRYLAFLRVNLYFRAEYRIVSPDMSQEPEEDVKPKLNLNITYEGQRTCTTLSRRRSK